MSPSLEQPPPPAALKPLHVWILLAILTMGSANPAKAQTEPAAAPAGKPLVLQSSPWL